MKVSTYASARPSGRRTPLYPSRKLILPNSDQIMGLNLPTGIPFVYEFDENMKPTVSMQFLGDEATVKAAMEKVAAQTGAKK